MSILNNQRILNGNYATPCYCYDMPLLEATVDKALAAAGDYHLHYAIKANTGQDVLRCMVNHGLGADTVSGGEVELALAQDFKPQGIFMAGVGKTDSEIRLALRQGIGCINVESVEELPIIEQIAAGEDVKAKIALRINPGIDAHTHHDITTGTDEDKFGIPVSQIPAAVEILRNSPHLEFKGLHFHIGSQVTDYEPFVRLCKVANALVAEFEAMGLRCEILDLGGGLGIDYDHPLEHPVPDFEGYFGTFRRGLQLPAHTQVHFELGRALVGQCGFLLTRVLLTKTTESGRRLCVVDAGFTELIRPALYGAEHRVIALTGTDVPMATYDLVGPVCESTDVMARGIQLPAHLRRGDLLAVCSAGAYGATMSMNYNCRAAAPALHIQ